MPLYRILFLLNHCIQNYLRILISSQIFVWDKYPDFRIFLYVITWISKCFLVVILHFNIQLPQYPILIFLNLNNVYSESLNECMDNLLSSYLCMFMSKYLNKLVYQYLVLVLVLVLTRLEYYTINSNNM